MTESDGGMAASLEYRSDLFEQDTIKRMCARFQALLAGIAQNPDCHLSDLPLLSDAERETILGQWNQTTAGDTEEHSAYALIEAQVEQSPHAVALISEQGELTYRELNATANRLAHYLREIGISAGSVAGLYVERGPEIVYGLLGLWKAGLTYLPLDTAQPQQRLAYMLSDAHAAVVLTQQRLLPRLPAGVRAVCLDSDWSAVAQCSPENPALTGSGDDIAYIMYTSGSTGRPKGVMVSQRAFANHCRDVQRCFQLSAADRVLQFTGVNFDPSLEQIAPTLMTGATIVLRGEQLWNPGDFHDKITRYGVTVANVPPAYWQQIVQEWPRNEGPERSTSLRLMIIGGDVVPPESLRIWQQTSLRRTRVLNAYGPTEAVITAAAYDIPADAGRHTARIPIGRPLPNRRAYILNKYGKPAPIGVAGELYLGGDRLAVGYLNDPEATAARFIADPFGPAGSRLYATGDLARYRADGNIEFLERADQQVKIRGMRVELGEIEAVLARHPDVRAVVVLAQADAERAGDKELVAYVTAHKDKTVAADEVRSFARAYLPDYMTPATIIVLDAFPLTASGKIDRRALPKPGIAQRARTQQYVAPRTPVEEQIAALWSQLLGVPQIGINDNFFELGGHSLLATQLVSRVRAMFQVEVSLLSLFESPTIAGVTLAIAQEQIKHLEMSAADELLNKLDQISDEDARRMSTGGSSV
jgi:amino acid adenylation domain-containing protein